MASAWHKNIQERMITEYIEKGYPVVKKEGKIGFFKFGEKITRKNKFKHVDILVVRGNEIILNEIEDRIYHTKKDGDYEYGVNYVELGGILFLSYLFAKSNSDKNIKLLLVFRNKIMFDRKDNIEKIVSEFKKNHKELTILPIRYMV
jgi:hypothetical protein